MNIQGISGNIPAQGPSQQSDPRIKSLDKQIADLQKRIRETRQNEKLDEKSKAEKIKEYEQQIQLLQQEKAKVQAEERQNKQKAAADQQPPATQEANNKTNVVDEHTQNAFARMDSLKNTEKSLGVVREQLKGELRIAESNSFFSRADPEAAAKARGKLAGIDRDTLRKAGGIAEDLNEAAKESPSARRDRLEEEESDREHARRGTGRMEPGQFLDDEA